MYLFFFPVLIDIAMSLRTLVARGDPAPPRKPDSGKNSNDQRFERKSEDRVVVDDSNDQVILELQ